jgi:MerR HTH family regulatory protein
MSVLLLLNLARLKKMKKTWSTQQAAKKMGVSFRTLNRWLFRGLIRPSIEFPIGGGRTLWRWTDADIAKGRKVKAAQKPGPKSRPKSKRTR